MRKRAREEKRKAEPGILRGVADELGITTPNEAQRPRRKSAQHTTAQRPIYRRKSAKGDPYGR